MKTNKNVEIRDELRSGYCEYHALRDRTHDGTGYCVKIKQDGTLVLTDIKKTMVCPYLSYDPDTIYVWKVFPHERKYENCPEFEEHIYEDGPWMDGY